MAGEKIGIDLKWRQPGSNGAGPSARGGHAVAAVGKVVYFFGGADRSATCFDDLFSFAIDQVTFKKVETTGDKPTPRSGATLSSVGNKLFLFGGRESQLKEDASIYNDLYELDTETFVWSKLECTGPKPECRNSHSAVVHGTKVYIFGGGNDAGPLGDLAILDTEGKSWYIINFDKGAGPEAREMHGATLVGGNKIFLVGGRGFDKWLNDFWFFDIDAQQWGKAHVAPFTRAGLTASEVNTPEGKSFVCVFGGVSEGGVHNDVHLFDMTNNKWTSVKPEGKSPATRFGHSQLAIDDVAYIFGGVNIDGDHNDLFALERAVDDLD